jgi:hypothetical protein
MRMGEGQSVRVILRHTFAHCDALDSALPGMLLHIDGSKHHWLNDDRWHDLVVILDDATSEIYYAQLVEEESTRTVMAALREVIETRVLFCSLYSDRGSHFLVTMKAGDKVEHRLTQVGRALKELGVHMIAAYSPQARGRSERSFGTWQGRLPQELRLAEVKTVEVANRFLREQYIARFNAQFTVKAEEKGTAFRRTSRTDLAGFSRYRPGKSWRKTTRWPSGAARGRSARDASGTHWRAARSPFTNISTEMCRCASDPCGGTFH